jgi:hypothetical protein
MDRLAQADFVQTDLVQSVLSADIALSLALVPNGWQATVETSGWHAALVPNGWQATVRSTT